MYRAVRITQMFIRLAGLTLLVLGVLIWTGHGTSLVNAHATLGALFVIALWVLAVLGARVGVSWLLVIRAMVWGVVTLLLGILQPRMMVGASHWMIQLLHLIVGMVTIGVGEIVAAAARRRIAAKQGNAGPGAPGLTTA